MVTKEATFSAAGHDNIASSFVLPREIHGNQALTSRSRAIQKIAHRVPPLLNAHAPSVFPGLTTCDKVFASSWLDPSTAVLGTKDNKLLCWNVSKNQYKPIPMPDLGSPVPPDSCGIHDIDISPSKRFLATGGKSPLDTVVFSVDSLFPVCLFKGHEDWVFGAKFLEDDCLISVSRDSTVSLFKVVEGSPGGTVPIVGPTITRREHQTKVRALQYHRSKKQIATMSVDSAIKIWDRENLDVIASKSFPDLAEMVCLAIDDTNDLLAVGFQQGVCLIDMRDSSHVMTISLEEGHRGTGVRSIDFYHHLTSIGGGSGRLSFFDLRNRCFVEMNDEKHYMTATEGWVDRSESPTILPDTVHHAIYTHKFDPLGDRLLVAGGPIMLGVKGCYASLW